MRKRDPLKSKKNLTPSERDFILSLDEDNHPAARYENLPDEVQHTISSMQIQIADLKGEASMNLALTPFVLGWITFAAAYGGRLWQLEFVGDPTIAYVLAVGLWIWSVVIFWRGRLASDEVHDTMADDHFRDEWELTEIVRRRLRDR